MSATPQGIALQFSASTDVNSFFIPTTSEIKDPSGVTLTGFKIKTVPQKPFFFNVTGSIEGIYVGTAGSSVSASVQLLKAPDPQPARDFIRETGYTVITQSIFIQTPGSAVIEAGSGQFNMVATSSVEFNDILYLRVIGFNNANTRNPSQFTASLHSFSITSGITGSVKELIIEPYLTKRFQGTDCEVLQGEALNSVANPFLQDLDYNTSATVPVNFEAIVSESADKGTVPESNFTQLANINPRYNGSKNQSERINEWTKFNGNIGNFGKTPSVDSKTSLIIYCDWIGGNKPDRNDTCVAHIQYIINEDGNIEQPNLKPSSLETIKHAFESGKNVIINLTDPPIAGGMEVLNGVKNIVRGGSRIESILYTQSGSIPDVYFTSSLSFQATDAEAAPNDVRASFIKTGTQTFEHSTPAKIEYNGNRYGGTFLTSNSYKVSADVISDNISLTFAPQLVFQTTNATLLSFGASANLGIQFEIKMVRKRGSNLKRYSFIPDPTQASPSNPNGLFDYFAAGIFTDNTTTGFLIGANKDIYFELLSGTAYSVGFSAPPAIINPLTIPIGELAFEDELYVEVTFYFGNNGNLGIDLIQDAEFYTSEDLSSTETFSTSLLVSQDPAFITPVTSPFWQYSGSNLTHITSSIDLGKSYGLYFQEDIPNSGFTKISSPFKLQRGDEFRFEGSEQFVYPVKNIIEPQNNNSSIKIEFYNTLPSGSGFDLNKFSVRRYVDDGSFIIFQAEKPGGASGPSIIKPQYTTDNLQQGVNEIIVDLTDKGLIS